MRHTLIFRWQGQRRRHAHRHGHDGRRGIAEAVPRALQSLSSEGRVAIIDVAARTVVGHIAVGDTPDGVAYTTRVAR